LKKVLTVFSLLYVDAYFFAEMDVRPHVITRNLFRRKTSLPHFPTTSTPHSNLSSPRPHTTGVLHRGARASRTALGMGNGRPVPSSTYTCTKVPTAAAAAGFAAGFAAGHATVASTGAVPRAVPAAGLGYGLEKSATL